jgi:hypothetical protein
MTTKNNTTPDPISLDNMAKLAEELAKDTNSLKATVSVEETKGADVLPPEIAAKIVNDFAKKYATNNTNALIGISKLVQDGGTNTGKPQLTRTINGIAFDLTDLRNIIKVHDNTGTVRKLAKTLKNIISLIALTNSWVGPLYKDLQRQNPTLTISSTDAIYCSEIHTDNHESGMPTHIREALQSREQKLRESRIATSKTKQPKGKARNNKKGKPNK